MSVTSNILQRTFRIRYKGNTGSCFTVDVEGGRYLITAKHVVESIPDDADVDLSYNGGWLPLRVWLVGHGAGDIDVTALAPQGLFGASHALKLTTAGLVLAEDIYFLGFPYGLGMEVKTDLNAGFPLPLVKKAAVSALGLEDGPILLDGHNNPGFSGGPVARRRTKEEQTVIGVVSGYRFDRHNVRDANGDKTSYTYDTNTGIIHRRLQRGLSPSGASLRPVPPGSGKDKDSRRVDVHEGELDVERVAAWIRAGSRSPRLAWVLTSWQSLAPELRAD